MKYQSRFWLFNL